MDYKNGKIYAIRSHNTDKVYVGSTTQPLHKRLSKHKWNYNYYKKNNDYKYKLSSFDIFDCGDAYIELIEEYPCENKMLLNKREGEIIRSMDCVNRIKNEGNFCANVYYHNNKDKHLESNRKWGRKKGECGICGEVMNNSSLARHIKAKH